VPAGAPKAGGRRKGRPTARAARRLDQHIARGADQAITGAIDAHIRSEQTGRRDDDDIAGALVPGG
jgi:hypothetical protein